MSGGRSREGEVDTLLGRKHNVGLGPSTLDYDLSRK